MPRRFLFRPDECEIPTVYQFRQQWQHVPDEAARGMIAVECQYLHFHRYLLASLHHQALAGGDLVRLGLSLRAGAVKSATLICGSIAEAALRAHAERRGYDLPRPDRRTFGRVLGAWQEDDFQPKKDVEPIWDKLQALHGRRNAVHLYRAIEDGANFYDVLAAEEGALRDAEVVLDFLKQIKS